MNRPLKLLVVRVDRLGDLILSTPVFEAVKRYCPGSFVSALVQKSNTAILEGHPFLDQCLIFDPKNRHRGLKGFFNLISDIRSQNFDAALVLHSHRKVALAIFLARVPLRVGPLSKLYSYFCFNRGLRQKRSQVKMHEADYNLQLLEKLGVSVSNREIMPRVSLSEESRAAAARWLKEQGWERSHGEPSVIPVTTEGASLKLVGVHPGMGGSALNWPQSSYQALVVALIEEGHFVLITAGPIEANWIQDWVQEIKKVLRSRGLSENRVLFYSSNQTSVKNTDRGLDFLAGLYSHADLIVAPSTGPLHLAAALGKSVLSFYPPIRVQSVERWGPYLKDPSRASVLVPQVDCGQDFKCIGDRCQHYPCMESITVDQALGLALQQLAQKQSTETESNYAGPNDTAPRNGIESKMSFGKRGENTL